MTASEDKIVRIWRADDREEPLAPRGHQFPVMAVAFSPSGEQIVSGSKDTTARVWRADGRGEPLVLTHPTYVSSVGFDRGGGLVVSAAQLQDARMWRIRYEDLRARILNTSKVCFTPDVRMTVLGSNAKEADKRHKACAQGS